jgi:kinesin family protein 15
MIEGNQYRSVGCTAMNRESSRSHSVFALVVETKTKDASGSTVSRVSRFNLVDLAGSERQSSTGSTGVTLVEAQHINTSLLTLGRVIAALAEVSQGKTRHIHYRDSKLTFLLRDSLGKCVFVLIFYLVF